MAANSDFSDARTSLPSNLCPSEDRLGEFCSGVLPEMEMDLLAQHIEQCAACQTAIERVGSTMRNDLFENMFTTLREDQSSIVHVPSEELAKVALLGKAARNGVPPSRLREYELLDEIGHGGMGRVYRALHTRLNRHVALKILSPRLLSMSASISRFDREMRALGRFSHPNIVQATDAGEVDGIHFLVMELVHGENLAQRLARTGPLSVKETCELTRQVCVGLQVAHDHKLIHRDIKPSNLMITPVNGRDCVKIMDLGLAELRESDATPTVDDRGVIVGTFDYISPEQVAAGVVDHRADLYSLGCTLFHMLTGEAPFHRSYRTSSRKLLAHATAPIPKVDAFRSDVPKPLVDLIARLMSKSPSDRPASAREVAEAIVPFCENSSSAIVPTQPSRRETTRARRFRTGVIISAAAALVLMLAFGAVFLIENDKGTLEIASFDKHVDVEVRQNGKLVTVLDTKTNTRVRRKSGEYELRIRDGGDVQLIDERVEIKRGDTVVARLTWKAKAKSARNSEAVGLGTVPAAEAILDSAERLRRIHDGTSPDSDIVAVLSEPLPRAFAMKYYPRKLALSPNGKILAVGTVQTLSDARTGPGTIMLIDAANGNVIRTMSPHRAGIVSLTWTPDSQTIISGSTDRKVVLTNVEPGGATRQVEFESEDYGLGTTVDSEGERLVVAAGKSIQLLDMETLTVKTKLENDSGLLGEVVFAGPQTLVGHGVFQGPNHVWTLGPGRPTLRTIGLHESMIASGIAASQRSPGIVWTCGYDGYCREWDTSNFRELKSLKHPWVVTSVSLRPDEQQVATSEWNGCVWIWDAHTGKRLKALTAFFGPSEIAYSRDGKVIYGAGNDKGIRAVDVNSGDIIWPKATHQSRVNRILLVPSADLVVTSASDGSIAKWDRRSHKLIDRFRNEGGIPNLLEYFPSSKKILVVSNESIISSWNIAEPKKPTIFRADNGECDRVSVSAVDAEGKLVALSRNDPVVDVWNVESKKRVQRLTGISKAITHLAITPDGDFVWGVSDGQVFRWRVDREGSAVDNDKPEALELPANQLTVARVGERMAVVDIHGTIRLLASNGTDTKLAFSLPYTGPVQVRALAESSRLLAFSTAENRYAIWDLTKESPVPQHVGRMIPQRFADTYLNDFAVDVDTELTYTGHGANCAIVGRLSN